VKRQFDTEIIVLCVRWYITYHLSYQDLVAMIAERGVIISHTTIMRWVIRYVPEFEKRWNRFASSIGSGLRAVRRRLQYSLNPSRLMDSSQAAVGCCVMMKCISRCEPCSISTKT
jgi:hypothetical protein